MNKTNKQTNNGQKAAEQATRAGLQLLPLIMNNIPQAVFWKDRDLVYLGCNQAFADDAGFASPEEIIGKTDFDMPWKDQAGLYRGDDRLVMEKGEPKLSYEEPQTTPSGTTIWLSTSKIPVYENDEVVAVLGMYEDVTERKQAEQALRESQQLLQTVMDNIPQSIFWKDRNLTYLGCNRAFAEDAGLVSPSDVIGKTDWDMPWKEQAELYRADDGLVMESGVPKLNYEEPQTTPDGSIIWLRTGKVPLQDVDGKVTAVLGMYEDITERKQAEEAVQETRARFQGLVETLSDWIWEVDQNGAYTYVSPKVKDLLGYEPEEVLGKTPFDFMPPEEAQRVAGVFGPLLSTQQPLVALENTNRHKDGRLVVFETSGVPFFDANRNFKGYRGTDRDVTQRKKAEQALRESQQLLQIVMDNIPQSIFWKDSNLIYLGCNKAFAADANLASPADVIGKTDWDMPWKEQAELYRADDSLVMKDGTPKFNYEEPQTQADGSTIWLRTSKVPLKGMDGNISAVLGMYEDITERKKLEQQIQTAFEQRGRQVQLSTQVSQSIAAATSLEELYERVVSEVKEQFGYYHTQILRYSATQEAVVLVTGYGEVGVKMLAEGHRLPMGEGLIGTAAATGETVLRPTLENDPDWHPNPLLPDTKGEIAVPIKLGNTVLGVLDIQSDVAGALGTDDQLLLEGLCGQIATAIESTRLRQEMDERLTEVDRLYRAMSHEGWQVYRQTENLPAGFIYNQMTVVPIQETERANETFIDQPIAVPGGEIIGKLSIADDPRYPLSSDDMSVVQQVSEQIALALESARLFDQTQSALRQSEKLFDASRSLTQATDLQELVKAAVTTLGIPVVNRALLLTFGFDAVDEIDQLTVIGNWWDGTGQEVTPIGTRYPREVVQVMPMFVSSTPVFFNDAFNDERVDETTMQLVKQLNLRAVAVLPLHLGSHQIGALLLEAEEPHNFTPEETRLFESLAPQIATVLENRQQYERAQRQAQREAMLNAINQKIQSATSVEAVLQIAARELGHALGAPMTIAQLSVKGQN